MRPHPLFPQREYCWPIVKGVNYPQETNAEPTDQNDFTSPDPEHDDTSEETADSQGDRLHLQEVRRF